jgi:hypothetical protein
MPTLSPAMKLALTAAALWAAYKYGNNTIRGLAMGAAGAIVLNQIPVVRDGADVRLVA